MGALPTHLIHTGDGRLYERSALPSYFEASDVYTHLVGLLSIKSLVQKRDFVEEVIRTYFQYTMLSHKWELPNEALFPDSPTVSSPPTPLPASPNSKTSAR